MSENCRDRDILTVVMPFQGLSVYCDLYAYSVYNRILVYTLISIVCHNGGANSSSWHNIVIIAINFDQVKTMTTNES